MLIERIEKDFEYVDDRGTLTQLVRKGYSQINIVTSKGGVFRGGHQTDFNRDTGACVQDEFWHSQTADDRNGF